MGVLPSRAEEILSEGTAGSAVGRWGVLVVAMAAAGWASFTLYERTRATAEVAPEPVPRDEIAPYVDAAQAHLLAGELHEADVQLTKASGLDEEDGRVLEGLALVEVLRAEQVWWQAELRPGDRRDAVERLDHDVDMARQAIALALRNVRDQAARARLKLYERRLNTFVVVAFARAGERERAAGALHARLEDHPQHELIAAYVAGEAEDGEDVAEGEDEASEKGGILEEEEAVPPRPAPAAHPSQDDRFEFTDEPKLPTPTTPGELQLPATVD